MSASGDNGWGISERLDRLEEIAETLEAGEIDLETARNSARKPTSIWRRCGRNWTSAMGRSSR